MEVIKYPCVNCHIDYPEDNFYKRSDTGKLRSYCKGCHARRAASYYKKNIPTIRARQRRWWLKKLYDLTVEEFERQAKLQSYLCDICREEKPLQVDHNHTTGKRRKLLCRSCNTGIGLFKESPRRLRVAAEYLERNS